LGDDENQHLPCGLCVIRYDAFYYAVRKNNNLLLDCYTVEDEKFMLNLVGRCDKIKIYQDRKNTCIKIKESCSNHFSDVCEGEV